MLSRDLAVSLGVPVAPGSSVASIPDVRQFIAKSGGNAFPIVLKALDGGGGRGIRLVHQLDQIEDVYERSVAPAYRAVSSMLMNVASKVLGREPLQANLCREGTCRARLEAYRGANRWRWPWECDASLGTRV